MTARLDYEANHEGRPKYERRSHEWLLPGVWSITEAGTPPRPLRPHETVTDVEALCRGVIERAERELRQSLGQDDFTLSLEQLFERAVVVSRAYAPRSAGIEFRPWLFQELYWDLIDFWRSWLGRHGEKRVPDTRPGGEDDETIFDHRGARVDRPDEPARGGAGDVAADRAFPGEWAEPPRDRGADRQVGGLRVGEGGGGPQGDGRRGAGALRRDARQPQGAARAAQGRVAA